MGDIEKAKENWTYLALNRDAQKSQEIFKIGKGFRKKAMGKYFHTVAEKTAQHLQPSGIARRFYLEGPGARLLR